MLDRFRQGYCNILDDALSNRWKAAPCDWSAYDDMRIAVEQERINHVAAPQKCPESYACVLWDQVTKKGREKTWVRFMRIPNR